MCICNTRNEVNLPELFSSLPESFAVEVPLEVQLGGKDPNSAYPFSSTVYSSPECTSVFDWSPFASGPQPLSKAGECEL